MMEDLFACVSPLFTRVSKERNRRNGENAHAHRRYTARAAVGKLLDIRHRKGGPPLSNVAFERARRKASRLVAQSGGRHLKKELARICEPV